MSHLKMAKSSSAEAARSGLEDIPLVEYKGVTIRHGSCRIYFTRHAQSWANVGHQTIDSSLSREGEKQAAQLEGHFNLILCSPLRRTVETLHHSQLSYDELRIIPELREVRHAISDCLPLEYRPSKGEFVKESDAELRLRCRIFHSILEHACHQRPGQSILIIGHAYYFNSWYRQRADVPPKNATIIRLL